MSRIANVVLRLPNYMQPVCFFGPTRIPRLQKNRRSLPGRPDISLSAGVTLRIHSGRTVMLTTPDSALLTIVLFQIFPC